MLSFLTLIWSSTLAAAAAAGMTPSPCGLDAQEPNDSRGAARPIDAGPSAGRACRGDDDWWRVQLQAGEVIEVGLLHEPGAEIEPPTVFPPHGRRPLGRPYFADGETGTRLVAPRAGIYRVRVRDQSLEGDDYTIAAWPAAPTER